jgi:hypothetical protein
MWPYALPSLAMPRIVSTDPDKVGALVSQFNEALGRDDFSMRPMGQKSGRTIYKVVSTLGDGELGETYEVVLSFAGGDRVYVERVAELLKCFLSGTIILNRC